jgi:hypothetical protein
MSAAVRSAEMLRMVSPPGDVEAWVRKAYAGQLGVYARGPYLDPECPTALLVNALKDRGIVQPNRRTVQGMGEYLITKLAPGYARPLADGPPCSPPLPGTEIGNVYEILCHAAEHGHPCPTNRDIAIALALRDHERARYLIGQLAEQDHIMIEDRGRLVTRVVTIMATQRSTSGALVPVGKLFDSGGGGK